MQPSFNVMQIAVVIVTSLAANSRQDAVARKHARAKRYNLMTMCLHSWSTCITTSAVPTCVVLGDAAPRTPSSQDGVVRQG
jgi:hypothetical protein